MGFGALPPWICIALLVLLELSVVTSGHNVACSLGFGITEAAVWLALEMVGVA